MPERITEAVLRRMRKGQVVRDTDPRGFYVRMGAHGRASYEVRVEGAASFFRVVGTSDVLSPSKAREIARKLLAQRTLDQHSPKRKYYTLDTAWPLHKAHLTEMGKSPRTIENYGLSLNRLDPKIRSMPLRALSEDSSLMRDEQRRIATRTDDGKHYRQKGHGRPAADATARTVRAVYEYTRKHEDDTLPAKHPCVKLDLTIKKAVHPLLALAPDGLPDWWRRIQRLENPLRREVYLFCLLSGLRSESLRTMQWVDMEADPMFCHIPKPKGGTHKAFDLILSTPMRDCLDRAMELGQKLVNAGRIEDARWVWPAPHTKRGHMTGLEADAKRVRRPDHSMRYGVYYNLHALRRTYSGIAERFCNVDAELLARFLNHKSAHPITAHYVRTSTIGAALVEAQERVSNFLMSGIEGRLID